MGARQRVAVSALGADGDDGRREPVVGHRRPARSQDPPRDRQRARPGDDDVAADERVGGEGERGVRRVQRDLHLPRLPRLQRERGRGELDRDAGDYVIGSEGQRLRDAGAIGQAHGLRLARRSRLRRAQAVAHAGLVGDDCRAVGGERVDAADAAREGLVGSPRRTARDRRLDHGGFPVGVERAQQRGDARDVRRGHRRAAERVHAATQLRRVDQVSRCGDVRLESQQARRGSARAERGHAPAPVDRRDRDRAGRRPRAADRRGPPVVARRHDHHDAGRDGIVDRARGRVVRVAAASQAQVHHVRAVGGIAVAVRVQAALDRGDDVGRQARSRRGEHLVGDQRRVGRDAEDVGRRCRNGARDVRAVAVVVHRIGIAVHEVPAPGNLVAQPEAASERRVRVVDARVDHGDDDAGPAGAEARGVDSGARVDHPGRE